MQRRYAIIGAIALAALVLIPGAAFAVGADGGFGHRGAGPGPKNLSQAEGDWPGNATHTDRTPGDGPGHRTMHRNETCAANVTCDRDCGAPTDIGNATTPVSDRHQPRFGNRTAANWTGTDESSRAPGRLGRSGCGTGR